MKDLMGQRFGRLTVKAFSYVDSGSRSYWLCLCECGNHATIQNSNLNSGKAKSCGCLQLEISTKHGHATKQPSSTYSTWKAMKKRCYNPKASNYKYYGGRGIRVCIQWLSSFECFLADMGERPNPEYSIDRIDVNGNYEPSNCRWATRSQQEQNKRLKQAA